MAKQSTETPVCGDLGHHHAYDDVTVRHRQAMGSSSWVLWWQLTVIYGEHSVYCVCSLYLGRSVDVVPSMLNVMTNECVWRKSGRILETYHHEKTNLTITKKMIDCRPPNLPQTKFGYGCNMIVGEKYNACDTIITVKSARWLLMPWHLYGTREFATVMMTQTCQQRGVLM